jgi:hypothetical protein
LEATADKQIWLTDDFEIASSRIHFLFLQPRHDVGVRERDWHIACSRRNVEQFQREALSKQLTSCLQDEWQWIQSSLFFRQASNGGNNISSQKSITDWRQAVRNFGKYDGDALAPAD